MEGDSSSSRFSLKMFLLALIVVVGLFAPVSAQDPSTLTIGTIAPLIDTLNPNMSLYGYNLKGLLYDTLVEVAQGPEVEPGLAESWSVSEDGLTWTFNIREGAFFSDGQPVTATEAAWSINWMLENEPPAIISYMLNFVNAEAPDPTTLLIHVSQPVPNMITSRLLYVYILPAHIWQGLSAEEITQKDDAEVTIGSGPYRMVDYQPSEYMVLQANQNYWRGESPVDQVIYREYANEDALVQALLAGEIDLLTAAPYSGIFALQADSNVQVDTSTAFQFSELSVNWAPDGTQPASLRDPIVRKAIDLSIDREQIISIAYLGYGQPATAFIMPLMGVYYNTDIPQIPYDIAEANRLLDEAGYADTNGDSIREDKEGNPIEYRLMTDDSTAANVRIIQIISDGLAQIGISAPPLTESTDSLVARQVDFDYDLIHWEWASDADPHFMTSIFTCAETVDGGWNDSGYCKPEYDALFEAQASALSEEDRKAAIWEMQEMIAEDRPWIMLAYTNAASAYRKDRFTFDSRLPIATLKWALYTGFAKIQ